VCTRESDPERVAFLPGDDLIEALSILGRQDDVADGVVGNGYTSGPAAWRRDPGQPPLRISCLPLGHRDSAASRQNVDTAVGVEVDDPRGRPVLELLEALAARGPLSAP
jgi:hypothetical protein